MNTRDRLRLAAGMAGALLLGLPASHAADKYPTRPIHMIVPYAPGGPADAHARLVAESLHRQLGQPVIIDNKPGALTSIGHFMLSQAEPDGYTIGMLTLSAAVLPATMKGYKVDPVTGFTPIAQYNYGEYAILANPKVPVRNFQELAAYARSNPSKFNIATGGGHLDLVIALLGDVANINWSMVRYKGVAPARLAVMAGEVDASIDTVGFAREAAAGGKANFIAVTGDERSPESPGTLTIAESGYPGFSAGFWWGFGGPPKMPPEAVAILNAAIRKAVETPEIQAALRAEGTRAAAGTPEQFRQLIAEDAKRWGAVATRHNIVQDN